jgi:putative ABC transport system substrate-binding protein
MRFIATFLLTVLTVTAQAAATQVAILQYVEHPALDAVRLGFVEILQQEQPQVEVVYYNAQGQLATAVQAAQKAASDKSALIAAIGTPAAQAALRSAKAKGIPLIFGAVSDPQSAGLCPKDGEDPSASGVTDFVDPMQSLAMMRRMMPQLKKLGLIYNPSESNSNFVVAALRQLAPHFDIELAEASVSSSKEVAAAAQSLVGQVQAFYQPSDNTVALALPLLAKIGRQKEVPAPVFVADANLLQEGAVAALSADYKEVGKQMGKMAVKLLRGAGLASLPIESPEHVDVYVNESLLDPFHLKPNSDTIDAAKVGEGDSPQIDVDLEDDIAPIFNLENNDE